jgi:adenylosuccinate synthase
MRQIVITSGHLCTGRTRLAKNLQRKFKHSRIKTSVLLKSEAARRSLPDDRVNLQKLGDVLDEESDGRWIFDAVIQRCKRIPAGRPVVVDSVYSLYKGSTFWLALP